jgi:hypothetical protein
MQFFDISACKAKKLYSFFQKINDTYPDFFEGERSVVRTPWHGTISQKSYSFVRDIKDVFYSDGKGFKKEKYQEAVGGSGDEATKNKILHSSSLCTFLFFSGIDEEHPLTIDGISYTEVYFEYKNQVISPQYGPSNIDVLLVHRDEQNHKNCLLFLESKFSEYYLETGQADVPLVYCGDKANEENGIIESLPNAKDYYHELGLSLDVPTHSGLLLCSDHGKAFRSIPKNPHVKPSFCFHLKAEGQQSRYCAGIKQMICHYIGLNNFANGHYWHEQTDQSKLKIQKISNPELRLGQIAFKFEGSEDAFANLETYYEFLTNNLGKLRTANQDIVLLNRVLTYQDVWANNPKYHESLNETIQRFYALK